jgi:glycosyltransferase involved in cell wall biosynthesis
MGGAEKLVTEMVPRMIQYGHQVDVLLFDGTHTPLKEQLEKEGINVYSLAIAPAVYNPIFIFQLITYLKKYDVVHTHNTACQLFVALASIFIICKKKPRLITTEHSTTNRRRKWLLYKYIDRWMYRKYHQVVAISEIAKETGGHFT